MNAPNFPANPPRLIRIPRGIRSKQKLFAVLADKLHFPRYFGRNWDALEELLRDLSWLPPGPITIVHDGLPFSSGGLNRALYQQLLHDVAAHWNHIDSARLTFVLPEEKR